MICAQPEKPHRIPSCGGRRILIIDDYPNAAESFAKYLQRFGHEIEVALDGWQGISAAERFRPDVVFLDIDMPDLNGYETAKRIREQPWSKKMVLIALTGWMAEERQLTRAAGFDAHLAKPLAHSEISALLVSFSSSARQA